jgi:hypothetical protein
MFHQQLSMGAIRGEACVSAVYTKHQKHQNKDNWLVTDLSHQLPTCGKVTSNMRC